MADVPNPEYTIKIVHEIVDRRTAANEVASTATANVDQQIPSGGGSGAGILGSARAKSFSDIFTARFMVSAGTRLLNAAGGDQISQTLGIAAKYMFLGARALAGDPVAIATFAVDLAATAIAEVRKTMTEQAAIQNEVDMARAQAGLLDLSGVKVTKHFFTGRYQYSRE